MSGDPEQEYFSDGITEDIITDLGKISALSIVSRSLICAPATRPGRLLHIILARGLVADPGKPH